MSNTVSYSGNKIIFSGPSSRFGVPESTASDYEITGAGTFHEFISRGVSSAGNVTTIGAVTVSYTIGAYTLTSYSNNGTLIIGGNAKVTFDSLSGNGNVYVTDSASLTITGNCTGTGIIYIGKTATGDLCSGAFFTVGGSIGNYQIVIDGNNSNFNCNDCSSVTIAGSATDANIIGTGNIISISSGAQETYIRGTNNVTNNGISTNIVSDGDTVPGTGAFGNITITNNTISASNTNGGIILAPNGTGEVTIDGVPVASENYVDTAVSAITKTSIGLGNVQNIKTNTSTVNPTVSDSSALGYSIGSSWINTVTDTVYFCTDATIGAALWQEVSNINNVGDVNAGNNLAAFGAAVFANKTGGTLNFRTINAGSAKVSVTELTTVVSVDVNDASIAHNSLQGYVANEHINHANVQIIAGTGLSGGGTIAASRTLALDINGLTTGTIDAVADFIPVYDVSGNAIIKVLASTVGTKDHGALDGLADDDHSIYALLAGRGSGQTLYGGANALGSLTLSSTGNASKGSIFMPDNIASTSTSTGTLIVSGGIGISGQISAATALIGSLTITGNVISGGATVSAEPTVPLGIATKSYVDSVAAGLDTKNACRVKALSLPSSTFSAGTITASANGLLVIDGVTVVTGDRILYDTETSNLQNGIYTVTAAGSAGTAWSITRASDANINAEVTNGMYTLVTSGTVYNNRGYTLITPDPIVVNTTPLTFAQFSSSTTYTASNLAGAGTGVFNGVVNNDFQFNRIAGSSSILVNYANPVLTVSTIDSGINHGSLAGLTTGDPHTQYVILAGRSGGQTVNGGTTSGNLTLVSNASNNGLIIISSNAVCNTIFGGTVAGGRLTLQGNNSDTLGGVTISSTTAGSVGGGALIVSGGASVSGGLFVGSNLSFSGNTITSTIALALAGTSVTTSAQMLVTNSTASTGAGTGALIVSGGASIGGNSTISGITTFASTTASSNVTTGAIVVAGGVGIGGNVNIGGNLFLTNGGGTVSAAGLIISNTASANVLYAGSMLSSGITAGANLTIRANNNNLLGSVLINTTTASTSTNTGALVVSGGVGIAGALFLGGNLTSTNATFLVTGGATGTTIIGSSASTGGTVILRPNGINNTGVVSIPGTAVTTSVTTGALVVAGGIGCGAISAGAIACSAINPIGTNVDTTGLWSFASVSAPILRANAIDTTGTITIPTNTASVSTSTGAVTVAGGVGIAGDLYIGGNHFITGSLVTSSLAGGSANNSVLSLRGSSTNTTGSVRVLCASPSTTGVNGALIVDGGIGVSGASVFLNTLSITGNMTVSSTTAATDNITGALVVSGGLAVALPSFISNCAINGTTISGNTNVTLSASAGAATLSATGGNVVISPSTGTIISGNLTITNGANSTIETSGTSLVVTGGSTGATIFGGSSASSTLTLQASNTGVSVGIVSIPGTLAATTASSAAMTVAGGVGIGGGIIISGNTTSGNCGIVTTGGNVVISSISSNGNITLSPHGTGQTLVSSAPTVPLGIATKGYVDAGGYLTLTGEVTSIGLATTVTNSAVLAKILTGFVTGSGDLASTDTILSAFQKLDGKLSGNGVAARVPYYSSTKVLTNDSKFTYDATGSGTLSVTNVTGNTELILSQVGDLYGTSRLLIRNRNAENGVIIETINPGTPVTDLIIKNSSTQRNFRLESRGSSVRAGPNSFHIAGADPDQPTLAAGDSLVCIRSGVPVIIGNYLTTTHSKLQIVDSGAATSNLRFMNSTTGTTATDGFEIGYTSSAFINNREATNLDVLTNNTTRLTVTSAGQVLIAQAPSTDTSAATKNYVDTLDAKRPCRVRGFLAGTTGGTAGPGRTITGAVALPTIDGVTLIVGNRILYDDGNANALNGIYVVTSVTSPWVLTRAIDSDTGAKLACGASVYIEEGATNGGRIYRMSTTGTIIIDTTALSFIQMVTTLGAISHSGLSGLSADDHGIYALLAGRGAGQTLHGGVNTAGVLTLRGNSTDLTGSVSVTSTTTGTSPTTGSFLVAGSAGIGQGIYVGKTGSAIIDINGTSVDAITSSGAITIAGTTTATMTGIIVTLLSSGNCVISPGNNTIISNNLTINNSTNTISTTNTNGNLTFSPNGTGQTIVTSFPTVNQSIATKEYVGYGGTCRVDAVFGNDSTASRNGGAFLTIDAAVAAALFGDTVILFPGTYTITAGLSPANGVIISGISKRACIINISNAAAGISAITMGANSSIENLTLSVSTTNNVQIVGVLFSGTTQNNSEINNCNIIMNKTNTGSAAVYGVYFNGTGSSAINNVNNCNVSVTSTGTGKNCAVYSDTANTCIVNGSTITSTAFAVESNNASAIIHLNNSLVSGTPDISQTLGSIIIAASFLKTRNTNNRSFTSAFASTQMTFTDPGTLGNGVTYFYYGTENTITSEQFYRYDKPAILYHLRVQCRVVAAGSVIVTVRIEGVASIMTVTLPANTLTVSTNNLAIPIAAGARVSVQANRSGTAPTDVSATLSFY